MKRKIFLITIIFSLSITCGLKAQKDSVIIESGMIDGRDAKRMSGHLKDKIADGDLDGALALAKLLNKSLKAKDLEKIIKENIKNGRLKTAYRAALLNNRELEFKEIYSSILIEKEPIDTVNKYTNGISDKEAYQLQKFYIDRGDLRSAEASSRISKKIIESDEYIKMSKNYFREKNFDLAIISAKKAGSLGREELGKLLKIFINLKDLDNAIKTAAAIGGKNLVSSEWFLLKRIIPPANLEDITEFINTGKKTESSEEAE